ncbi:D-alanyl-D-alanine carboxypeptidase-like protein [Kineococcus xinjiangensis]|uniref:D-alanyl-D-alanine carboxypeptidase-like protein n=1 Tax=Kineococcus xinjiangensis TaxID=512762 RepID=A0A2S6IWS5_9ACTN|nr:M15 family metallopeptidase [Kineococcus xinjiangensis]PPK98690.1 D-alanyl-D-alanine carboxypeptidase-like protein [Kineococcus xinjiangensis]
MGLRRLLLPVAAAVALGAAATPVAGAPGTSQPGTSRPGTSRPAAADALPATGPILPRGSRAPAPADRFVATVTPVTAADLPSSYRPGCPVPPERLRRLTVSHVDFLGRQRLGTLVVHQDVADPLVRVFARLHALQYPIERMEPVEAFAGSDDASMDANNTSAFNCRARTGGTGFSEHSHGTALDLNPVQNPYVRGTTVLPEAGRAHVDRSTAHPAVLRAGDPVVSALAAEGFRWGGTWTTLKDYQHFSTSGR